MNARIIVVLFTLVAFALGGCSKKKEATPTTKSTSGASTKDKKQEADTGASTPKSAGEPDPSASATSALASKVNETPPVSAGPKTAEKYTGPIESHPLAIAAKAAWKSASAAAASGDRRALSKWLVTSNVRLIGRLGPQLPAFFAGEVKSVAEVNGGRVTLKVQKDGRLRTILAYHKDGATKIDIIKSRRARPPNKGEVHPLNKPLTVAEATAGVRGVGQLWATIDTSKGELNCKLFEVRAPKTVANFVGLARGKRGFRTPNAEKWTKRPYFNGLAFHRVIPNFMIQGGCPLGTGKGGPGYAFEDEFDLTLRHDRGGLLSMANSGPNTNGSQFFVTEKATPQLDDGHTIFGECKEIVLVRAISRVPSEGRNKPLQSVVINTISFVRKP